MIQSQIRTNFQSADKYQGSDHVLPSTRGAVSDTTLSQVMMKLSTRSSSSGENKFRRLHDVQLLALSRCHRLSCLSTPYKISTSTNAQQLKLSFHHPHLSNRKCNVSKFTGVQLQQDVLRLYPPPLSNKPTKVTASSSPIHRPMKTRTRMIMTLHLRPLAFLLSSCLVHASLLILLAVITNPFLHLTPRMQIGETANASQGQHPRTLHPIRPVVSVSRRSLFVCQ